MKDDAVQKSKWEALLEELEGIRDVYRLDVKQFIGFVREKKLLIVDGFRRYAAWLEEEHDGRRYSPADHQQEACRGQEPRPLRVQTQRFRRGPAEEVPAGGDSASP